MATEILNMPKHLESIGIKHISVNFFAYCLIKKTFHVSKQDIFSAEGIL